MKRKFTFIELLVVLAIMAILLSLLLPRLREAREKSLHAVCCSNLSQINTALNLYVKNNKGKVPPKWGSVCSWVGNPGTYPRYTKYTVSKKYLNKYLGFHNDSENVLMAMCPSANADGEWFEAYGTDYYANNFWSPNDLSEVKFLAKVKDPSRMVAFHEGGAWYACQGKPPWSNLEHRGQDLGTYNTTFTDDHVSMMFHFNLGLRYGDDYTFDNER